MASEPGFYVLILLVALGPYAYPKYIILLFG